MNFTLSPWSTVLVEKLIVPQPVTKFPVFCEIPNVHYRVHNSLQIVPILSQIGLAHELSFDFSNIYFNIIPHLHLGLPSGIFPSAFTTKILHAPLLSPTLATFTANLIPFDFSTQIISDEQYLS